MANNEFVEPEQCRTVLIAMDASKHSDYAFECKYIMASALDFGTYCTGEQRSKALASLCKCVATRPSV